MWVMNLAKALENIRLEEVVEVTILCFFIISVSVETVTLFNWFLQALDFRTVFLLEDIRQLETQVFYVFAP